MHDPYKDFGEVFFALCKSVDTPKSLALWLAYKHRSSDVFKMSPRADDYNNAHQFSVDYLCSSYVSKIAFEYNGIDKRAVALSSFAAAETQCKLTNRRIRDELLRGCSPRVEAVIFAAQRKISSLLGSFRLSDCLESCRWGPGATSTIPRRNARPDQKQCASPFTVTSSALPLFKMIVESDPIWLSAVLGYTVDGPCSLLPCCFTVVRESKVVTVPKSAKTDRTICSEPTANGFLQQGVGRYLRLRLKRVGINLDDQTVNQSLARSAVDLGLATLDLKAASDSISTELVKLLLPPQWFDYLNRLRVPFTRLPDGSVVKLEKFSAMGNAFTFELETLIFWALTSACCDNHDIVSVYGDDIICPQRSAAEVVQVLLHFGFETNTDKSFVGGRFFESCGKHYFDGIDVTPVYQKNSPRVDEWERIRAHNRLMRWSVRSGLGYILDPTIRNTTTLLKRGRLFFGSAPLWYQNDDSYIVPWTEGEWKCHHGLCVVKRLVPDRRRPLTNHLGAYSYSMYVTAGYQPTDTYNGVDRRVSLRYVVDLLPHFSVGGPCGPRFTVELATYRSRQTDVAICRDLMSVDW